MVIMTLPLMSPSGLAMTRQFIYCRVSTSEQTTENQLSAIRQRGYNVQANRIVSETVSGGIPTASRNGFRKLVDKLEAGDELIVLKIDRLGRDAIDVLSTVESLGGMGVKVISLDLPVPDLSKPEGKMMLGMFSVFAEFEKNRIRERTQESLNRLKAEGVKLGRPEATETTERVQQCKAMGLSQAQAADHLRLSVRTVKRHWHK